MTRSSVIVLATALAVTWTVVPAAAQPSSKQRAKYEQAFRRGNQLFEDKQWAKARIEFEAAYEIDPKPLLLFNIASTYRREGDHVNARVYYQWYLDKGDDQALVALARSAIADLDVIAAEPEKPVPAEPIVLIERIEPYPRAELDRPWTLPRGTFAGTVGGGVFPRFELPVMGAPERLYEPFAVMGAAVGVSDRVQLSVEADLGISTPDRSFLLASVAIGLYHGANGAIAASATFGYSFEPGELAYGSFGARVRWRLGPRFAVVSTEDQLLVASDNGTIGVLRLPVGLSVQIASVLYAAISTRLVAIDVGQKNVELVFADFRFATLELVATPMPKLDVVTRWRAYDDGTDALIALRYRL